ncbi:MAG: NAD-binding protein [Pirellulaceae bacterium]
MSQVKLKDHVVVCGWSSTAAGIISELHAEHGNERRQVVLIDAKLESSPVDDPYVYFVKGDPTSDETLERADIGSACTALVLADWTITDLSLRDAKTTLITMAIEDHNGDVYTVVELMRPENRRHLERADADEAVCVTDLSKRLLVHAAMNHGLSRFFTDILAFDEGSEIYKILAPVAFHGVSFRTAVRHASDQFEAIIMGVERDVKIHCNPVNEFLLEPGDYLFVLSEDDPVELTTLEGNIEDEAGKGDNAAPSEPDVKVHKEA